MIGSQDHNDPSGKQPMHISDISSFQIVQEKVNSVFEPKGSL
jgi:hypothetical protein